MPITPTYPGVYIEEVPSGIRTIVGVGTSAAAFVGYTQRGPARPVQIFNYGDYERQFGGLHRDSPLSFCVQQFFLNGGSEAWVVRVAEGAAKAGISLRKGVGLASVVLVISARTEGSWGNQLRVEVDYDTANPDSLFNLTVTELVEQNGTVSVARAEKHRNLSMSSYSPTFVEGVVNAASDLVEVRRTDDAVNDILTAIATSTSGVLGALPGLDLDHRRLAVTLNGNGLHEFDIFDPGEIVTGLDDLADRITAKVIALDPLSFDNFACVADLTPGAERLEATAPFPVPNDGGEKSVVRFSNASIRNAAAILKLGVSNGGREVEGTAAIRPASSGTTGTSLAALDLTTLPADASIDDLVVHSAFSDDLTTGLELWGLSTTVVKPLSLEELRSHLQSALTSSPKAALNQARVSLVDNRLQIVAGGTNPNVWLSFSGGEAAPLGLEAAAAENVARYALGVGLSVRAQADPVPGSDGTPPAPQTLKGSRAAKTGIYALEDVDLFNILCIPQESPDISLVSEALAYAAERRAFMILDFPSSVNSMVEAKDWLSSNLALRHKNAAIYFPRIYMADPLDAGRLRAFLTCGAVAGLYARTDAERGVWKAPAGTEASLRGVQKLDYLLTDPENGVLNPLGINAVRTFPVYGPVVWGGRTLEGADVLASQWKYVPVRRFALFLEESLFRGTKWVVFEPNDEPLWAQIRLNIGAFMHGLFRQGAFQGQTPREAYFVKCDKETTTQADINLGIVNILVGFAPLKPAEFVMVRIQQMAGQIPT